MIALPLLFFGVPAAALDQYGGWTGLKGEATGFFHTQQIDGRWWLVDPEGNVFWSIGVNAIRFEGDTIRGTNRQPYKEAALAKYGSLEAWTEATLSFLRDLGFNTIGAWSGDYLFEKGMPYTIILNVAARAGANWVQGKFIDVWDPRFEETAEKVAAEVCAPRRASKLLIGYFTDNELHWGPDWRARTTLLEEYLMMPPEAPGHARAVEFLKARYESIGDLNAAWHINLTGWDQLDGGVTFDGSGRTEQAGRDSFAFLEMVARRYFEVCHSAIRRHDPNHLIMGCRLAGVWDVVVPRAAKGLVDVFSANFYVPQPQSGPLEAMAEAAGAPVVITEWSFRSRDSGLPNTKGAGPLVNTMAERAQKYRDYLTGLLKMPVVVGAHWFKHCDEPAEGRFDGENSNYGLVNIKDEPYQEFLEVVREVNARAYEIRLAK
ncbi:MAG: agarase [Armatimonadetes bacterium]|nr:agarase [Armatimonadota bacterium]